MSATLIITDLTYNETITWFLWCQLISWMVSALQSVVFYTNITVTRRFCLTHCAFWTSIGLAAFSILHRALWNPQEERLIFGLHVTNGTIALLRAICCLLIPRRPDVYHEGKLVDREYTVGLWSRLSLGYISPFIYSVGRNRGLLALEDFPKLRFGARSEHLHDVLWEFSQGRSLFRSICKAHSRELILQLVLSVISSLLSYTPQVMFFFIIQGLEYGAVGSQVAWAIALGIAMCVTSSLNTWVWWFTYSRLTVPIHAELQALIYGKIMRHKNVQQVAPAGGNAKETLESIQQQGQQETMNLVTIDTQRISDYATYNHLFPYSAVQFIIACLLLLFLIGWQSLLAGLLAVLLVSPLNIYIVTVFSTFQYRLMDARDKRAAAIHEVLKNMRQIKFSAHESAWQDRVLEARRHELRLNYKSCAYETGFQAMWTLTPLLLSAVSLTVYALLHGQLSAPIAFTAISVFGPLEVTLAGLPHLLSALLEAKVSINRIERYFKTADKLPCKSNLIDSIVFRNAEIAWPMPEGYGDAKFRLSELSFQFPPNGLTLVTGPVGCGKTLLLSSILGECEILRGSVQVSSRGDGAWEYPRSIMDNWIIDSAIAYVAQNPWTENGTIRDNILFGLPLDRLRYQEVLFASGLERDLDILQDGDQTDIGSNGVNLSGGQRLRVSFARALYSRAGILILDDIFSALDADTSYHVYENGLTGHLAENRTRILATHHAGLCIPKADYCVVLANGLASYAGSAKEFRKMDAFADFFLQDENKEDGGDTPTTRASRASDQTLQEGQREYQAFSPEEQRARGSVAFRVYRQFLAGDRASWIWALGISVAVIYTACVVGRSWWLVVWTRTYQPKRLDYHPYPQVAFGFDNHQVQNTSASFSVFAYIGVYIGLSLAASLTGTIRFFFIRVASVRSSQAAFKRLLAAVLAAPLRWIDTVPLGRVLNRFTSDMYTADYLLGTHLAELILRMLQTGGILVATSFISPIAIAVAAVLLVGSILVSIIYLRASREVKRLQSVSRTPILEQFNSTIIGLTTIRAFGATTKYIASMFGRIDDHSKVSWNLLLLNSWLQMRVGLLGAIFSAVLAILVVELGVSASLAGFAISFLLQYNSAVLFTLRYYGNFEMDMNAAERILEFAGVESEPQDGLDPSAAWPTQGRIVVNGLVVKYSHELPPVLKGITFSIESNERVGIVGRTGSGKSTLALTLFRFLEATEGHIYIDGLDISKLNVHALRRGLAIVPQHPTLFAGTIRSNLDPFDWYSELELNNVLERVHLVQREDESINSFSLDTTVSGGGANLSQGQRQLLCLARAILQRPKIMILDEATSAVDMKTDEKIQHAIRTEFGRNMSTLLVIAHRLSTIADFDRILVMDEGRIVEFGTPRDLMSIEGGFFRDLVNQSGEKVAVKNIILGGSDEGT
ncbi:hypothetical protein O1611_g2887 [Lasiodiplodia mahajangana]|uniref:Uncharacterized protein n=1 Tax=Lasiodiplodia mahajangana TaxID=1108764 RepID=A0ACC2JTC6_9PEZI|nr:hypothetical protein O1611_g2887 [Lasiodiplodia mahajangana]